MKRAAQILLLLSAGFLFQPTLVSTAHCADCVIQCMSFYQPNQGMTYDHKRELCEIQCKGKTATPTYGAIAYSRKDKLWGYSYNQPAQAGAEKMAFQNCVKQGGAKCVIEASFHNTCGAIASAGDGSIVTWGIGGSKYNAQQYAEAACHRAGGKGCEAQASICSSPDSSGASVLGGASAPSTSAAPASAPARKISWGAIAYSSGDMSAGWSLGKDDRATAEKEAMAICAQRGKACTLRTAFNKQCAALAADRNLTGLGTAADQREANQKAVDECKRAGGARCVLHVSFCSN
jgi:Domain of unknown function (DUF4189)